MNLTVFIPAYNYSDDYDDYQLNSLANQTCKSFNLLFVDPHCSDQRKLKIEEFQKKFGIKSLYFPYQRDPHPRTWDWAIMNVPFMLMENSHILRYQQHRIIHKKLIEEVIKSEENKGFQRFNCEFNETLFPLMNDEKGHLTSGYNKLPIEYSLKESCFTGEITSSIQNDPGSCYGDWCLKIEDFLKINGVDEATTAVYHFEDIDFNLRWDIARDIGLLSPVKMFFGLMGYFDGKLRNKNVKSIKKTAYEIECINCKKYSYDFIWRMNEGDIAEGEFENIGIKFGKEWFKCKECGIVILKAGKPHFSAFKDRMIQEKVFKASIGVGNYGRDLNKIRSDVLNTNDFNQKVEIINNSWTNQNYKL